MNSYEFIFSVKYSVSSRPMFIISFSHRQMSAKIMAGLTNQIPDFICLSFSSSSTTTCIPAYLHTCIQFIIRLTCGTQYPTLLQVVGLICNNFIWNRYDFTLFHNTVLFIWNGFVLTIFYYTVLLFNISSIIMACGAVENQAHRDFPWCYEYYYIILYNMSACRLAVIVVAVELMVGAAATYYYTNLNLVQVHYDAP